LLDEEDVILGLRDEDVTLRSIALDCAENISSELIANELVRILDEDTDDFIVAWTVVTLSMQAYDDIKSITKVEKRWSESEIVQASTAFYYTYMNEEVRYLDRFLHFLLSNDHLTRGLVIKNCGLFSGTKYKTIIVAALEKSLEKESVEYLIELIKESIVELEAI